MAVSSTTDENDDVGTVQSKKYSAAVGRELPASMIDEVLQLALSARPPTIYDSYSEIPVPWKHLIAPRWSEKVSALVDLWANDESNIKRAETCVGRRALKRGQDLPGCQSLGGLGNKMHAAQTVVFIALTDLTPDNGFFMHLRKGEDVCLDSNADVRFPAPGGGLGVSFVLDI